MVYNPYEPHRPGPFETSPRAPVRRGADYELAPIGPNRHVDVAHLRRQEWTGRAFLFVLLIFPVVYAIGWDIGWW
ncbi:MAG: hypothetical protein H6838_10470 [Planctomycetes bacterium]|nr:hypothetical protein [Planctomycetota bacterium]MCB9885909.1 hypothetical protein [Planctomycetota bacterium]